MEIKNIRQGEALAAWEENNFVGTVMAVPAFGKMWVFFKAVYLAYECKKIPNNAVVWFWAETNERYRDLLREAEFYNSAFNKNILNDFNIVFKTYQSLSEGERDMDAYDENSSLLF